ncbi:DUF6279 family lipoprotein [Hydrogenophaga sp.]|uniref:DUF6279 family lipoprotein n=1 Tax=Hydrogenophaga sp. TaxID=1904254 RepID=UPI00286E63A5|nr:DUF6279 family lipoprotein [Hydrogenophaga sp.]
MAQIIAARFWRPLALAAVAALLLAGCSALRLGYQQAPSLIYWWVDGYADLDDAQSGRVRQDIDRFLAWHRQTELPAYADRLRQWRALAAADLSAEQVCAQTEVLRTVATRLIERGHEPLARLALSLTPAQLQHMERHQAKSNEGFEKDFLRGSAEQRLERRLERAVDRYETIYGALSNAQVAQVRQSLRDAPFDPARTLADRRARQAELLGLIRQLQAAQAGRTAGDGPAPRAAAQALQAWLQRGLFAAPSAGGEAAGWVRHGCQAFAALHNSTSAAQRQHAQQEIRRYEDDLRALAAQD